MAQGDIDVTLNQWLSSAWFRHLARLSMIVGTFIAGYAGVTVANIRVDVEKLRQNDVMVQQTLAVRTADQERFQLDTDKDLTILRAALAAVDADVSAIKVDAATIRGILQEMQRREKAQMRPSVFQP